MLAWIEHVSRWIRSSGLFFWRTGGNSEKRSSGDQRHVQGAQGERIAEGFVKKLGYKILARGYRTRLGEIDIIALDHCCLVFIEVKTWKQPSSTDPSAAVDHVKQGKITRTALAYLKRHKLLNQPARFDVIAIILSPEAASTPSIRHYKAAFEAVGVGQLFR